MPVRPTEPQTFPGLGHSYVIVDLNQQAQEPTKSDGRPSIDEHQPPRSRRGSGGDMSAVSQVAKTESPPSPVAEHQFPEAHLAAEPKQTPERSPVESTATRSDQPLRLPEESKKSDPELPTDRQTFGQKWCPQTQRLQCVSSSLCKRTAMVTIFPCVALVAAILMVCRVIKWN